jgi:cytochrome c-type biogenesis protein CcmF
MLFWCLVSAIFAAILAVARGGMGATLWSRALGMQGLLTFATLLYTLVLSNPFARLDPAPFEGRDLNPLLQDPALALHPPMLYAGYVGLSIPFSLAIAALLEGKVDQAWARALRPWTLAAWTLLTIGITLGSYWAYYELGWGGWWFWDPVENASFMPWLAAAALLHSAIVTERRGSLAAWTALLAILAFGLSLLGAFLVRSGVLTSVHAFAVDPERGLAILALLGAVVGGGLLLFAWRAPRLGEPHGFVLSSREGALLLNNLGLAVAAGTVLAGTLYPLLLDAATGEKISVGPPFFDATFGPLMAVLFAILPFGPLLAWRRGDTADAVKRLTAALLAALAAALFVLGVVRGPIVSAIGIGLGVWLIAGAFVYLGKRWGKAGAGKALALPLAVWAMVLAHAGLGVFTIGAVAERVFRQEATAQLMPGESTDFVGRRITLQSVNGFEGPNYLAQQARLTVEQNGRVQTLVSEIRRYPVAGSTTTEVGILSGLSGDLYVALGARTGDDPWILRLYFNPLVHLVFGGAALMALGGAVGLAALARRRVLVPVVETAPAHASVAE